MFKKADHISSAAVEDFFIIINGHTWVNGILQKGISRVKVFQIWGLGMEYPLLSDKILSWTGFTSCEFSNIGLYVGDLGCA